MLKDKKIVFTGFRDPDLELIITKNGGSIQNNVNSKTHYLIIKSREQSSKKIEEAEKMNIKIMTRDEFLHFIQQ